MAGNPLYPGYVPNPKDEPINPIYPGYFPGQAEVRPPRGPDIKPNEFNFNQITQIIDNVTADTMLAGPGMPAWIAERALDDFKQQFKISIKPSGVKAEDLDDYSDKNLPGAFGVGISINPMDWIEDPGKQMTKTLKSWATQGANWQDMETRFRVEAWSQVFKEDIGPDGFKYGDAQAGAVSMLGGNLGASIGKSYDKTANPLKLIGRDELNIEDPSAGNSTHSFGGVPLLDASGNVMGVTTPAVKAKTDLGAQFATNIGAFETESNYGTKREGAYDKVVLSGYEIAARDLQTNAAVGTFTGVDRVLMDNAIKNSQARLSIIKSMESIGKEFKDYTGDIQKDILKAGVLGGVGKGVKIDLDKLTNSTNSGVVDKINKHLENIENQLSSVATGAEADLLRKRYIDKYKKQVESVLKNPALKLAEEARLNPASRADIALKLEKLNPVSVVNSLSGEISGGYTGAPLTGGDIFKKSISRQLARDSMEAVTHPGLHGNDAVGHAIGMLIQADNTSATQVVLGGVNMIRNEAQIMGSMDFLDAIEQGKFSERYIWPRVKSYVEASTPAAYADRFLKKHHYFGLNLAESKDADFEQTVVYKIANLAGGGSMGAGAPNKMYGNYFTVKSIDKSSGVRVVAKVYGGSHFDGVDKLSQIVGKGLNTPGGWSSAEFAELMNANDLNKLHALSLKMTTPHLLPKGVNVGDKDSLESFINDISKFKKWVDANESRIMVAGVAKGSPEYYANLIKLLQEQSKNPDFNTLKITGRYAGQIQKLYFKLNSAQSAVVKKFGKALAPLAYARQIASDFLAKSLTQLIAWLSGAATGGTAYAFIMALEKPLRIIINFVLGKAMDIAKGFYDAIVKADLDAGFKVIDKAVEAYSKVLLLGMGLFVMIFVVPTDKFMRTVAVSFSPVDNTIGSGVKDNFSGGGQHFGSGAFVQPVSFSPSAVDCFNYIDFDGDVFTSAGVTYKLIKWPGDWKTKMEVAVMALKTTTRGYLSRLCDEKVGGKVNLAWAENSASGFCGLATGKGSITGNDTIVLGHGACWSGFSGPAWYYNYLFSHETAHIYNYRYGFESYNGITFEEASRENGKGTLPTYIPGGCNNASDIGEDFADTLGNWVQLNTYDCGNIPVDAVPADKPCDTAFWKEYPLHCQYADKVFTRPEGQ